MSKLFWNLLKATPVVLGASFLSVQSATAAPERERLIAQTVPTNQTQIVDPNAQQLLQLIDKTRNSKQFGNQVNSDPMSQVTSVNQLRDVEPTAWAYEALRSLVERYGCIVGYPDRTFRGDRALTRWEFAAGLNACLNVIERLLQENVAVLKEDIDKLKRLAQEFQAELAALSARVDNLETRTAFLEDHQFSTTTKLKGEVIFSLADSFGNQATYNPNRPLASQSDVSQTAFNDRVRLNLETSFTGKDMLRTRLQAGNFDTTFNQRGVTGTNMTRLSYDDGRGNDLTIDDLFYRFPIGDKVTAWVGPNQLNLDDVFNTVSPFMESSGTGALARLERYNNLVYRGPSGAGTAFRYKFNDTFNITATYLADSGTANSPLSGNGLFNGSFSTGVQLGISPMKSLDLALTYVYSYQTPGTNLFGGVSSPDAERPFGSNVASNANRAGLQFNWRANDWFNWNAWGGYAKAEPLGVNADGVDIWTWNTGFSFVDLGKEGAVLTLAGGMPPKGQGSRDTSYLIETQYKYPITDNILITPGFYVLFNPNNDARNDTQWMGVIRTTFRF